jgi:hypothetical protein
MQTYKYIEPDTGFTYTMTVSNNDSVTIDQLQIGSTVTLSTGHQLGVNSNGHVTITDKNGKHSSAILVDFKNGLIT